MSDTLTPEDNAALDAMREADAAEPEVRAEPEAHAEPEAETQAEPEAPQPQEKRRVPLAEVLRERERRQAAEAKARDLELNQARLDERLRALTERLQPQQQEQAPDLNTDPVAYIRHLEGQIAQVRQAEQARQQQTSQASEAQAIMARAAAQEAEYRQSVPDYADATTHLQNARAQQLQLLGFAPEQIRQQIGQEALAIAAQAAHLGKNPGEVVYALAKSIGYVPKAGGAKLDTVARGQQLAAGAPNGSAPSSTPSAASIAAMSEAEFAKLMAKNPDAIRAAMGG